MSVLPANWWMDTAWMDPVIFDFNNPASLYNSVSALQMRMKLELFGYEFPPRLYAKGRLALMLKDELTDQEMLFFEGQKATVETSVLPDGWFLHAGYLTPDLFSETSVHYAGLSEADLKAKITHPGRNMYRGLW